MIVILLCHRERDIDIRRRIVVHDSHIDSFRGVQIVGTVVDDQDTALGRQGDIVLEVKREICGTFITQVHAVPHFGRDCVIPHFVDRDVGNAVVGAAGDNRAVPHPPDCPADIGGILRRGHLNRSVTIVDASDRQGYPRAGWFGRIRICRRGGTAIRIGHHTGVITCRPKRDTACGGIRQGRYGWTGAFIVPGEGVSVETAQVGLQDKHLRDGIVDNPLDIKSGMDCHGDARFDEVGVVGTIVVRIAAEGDIVGARLVESVTNRIFAVLGILYDPAAGAVVTTRARVVFFCPDADIRRPRDAQ